MLELLRPVPGFEAASLAGDARPLSGGFWASLLLVPLAGARTPAVVLRLMPDDGLARKETAFQREAARQGLPVPEVFLAGDRNSALGLPFLAMAHAPGAMPLAGLDGAAALRRLPDAAHALPALLGRVTAAVHRLDTRPFLDALRGQAVPADTASVLRHYTDAAAAIGRADLVRAAGWLAARRPAPRSPVVCHGDLHPFNLLVCDGRWTLLDWTAAAIAEPSYDLAFTSLLLRHPPLAAPGPLQPAIAVGGRYAARRLLAGYRADGGILPEPARLEWHTALHALRIVLEVESWRQDGTLSEHSGHPWISLEPVAARALRQITRRSPRPPTP
jgi:aminoglycoside phosphotransferase (APT) family kinase protein